MKEILVLVEGQTEETFIRDVLNEYFIPKGVSLTSKIITTKIVKHGPNFKGGVRTYGKIKNDLTKLLKATHVKAVTTMFDYYQLPSDFPGKDSFNADANPYDKVCHLEDAFAEDIDHPKFVPFLMLHEFETYLFADPTTISTAFPDKKDRIGNKFISMLKQCNNPELINDGPTTHPSARILNIVKNYQKTQHGPIITKRIGLDAIRKTCSHFNDWIKILESSI